MADRMIRPDLEGREHLSPWQERFRAIQEITKGLTFFITGWAVILLTALIPFEREYPTGWLWAALKCVGLGGAAALSSLRLSLRRWSWLAFAAALALHGFGLYKCLGLGDVDTEGMGYFSLEMLLLAGLLAMHGLWSLAERGTRKEDDGK